MAAALGAGVVCRRIGLTDGVSQVFAPPETLDRFRSVPTLLLCLAVHFALCWISMSVTRHIWGGRLAAFHGELRAQGLPVSLADFREDLPATAYADAGATKALEAQDPGVNKKMHPGKTVNAWTSDIEREETAFVRESEAPLLKVLAFLRRDRPARYARVDWAAASKKPWGYPIPKFSNLIAQTSTLWLSAGWRAYHGEAAPAWDRIRLMTEIDTLVSSERSLIGKMIATAIRQMAAKASCSVLLTLKPGAMPADLARTFSAPGPETWPSGGLRTELAQNQDMLAVLTCMRWKEFLAMGGIMGGLIQTACLEEEDKNPCTEWIEQSLQKPLEYAALRLLQSSGILELNTLETGRYFAVIAAPMTRAAMSGRVEEVSRIRSNWTNWPHFMAMISMPKFDNLIMKGWEAQSWSRMALSVSALQAHRAAHGRHPDRLEALAPRIIERAVLMDPFSETTFRYSPAPDGKAFSLCSAGPKGDFLDNGGSAFCVPDPVKPRTKHKSVH